MLFFLISIVSLAGTLPFDVCRPIQDNQCNEFMEKVRDDFQSNPQLSVKLAPGIYAGDCHYLSMDYAADHKHYAGLYLESKQDEDIVYFNGSFAFFAAPDEYDDWDLEEARRTYPDPYRFPMSQTGEYSIADYMPDGGIWQFWMTQDPESREIQLISHWGGRGRGFCRLYPRE